jgi:outer membrane protein OmpA-like peptidoglycan-associated protein
LTASAGVKLDIHSLPLSEKLAKKGFEVPLNPLIPSIDGMRIKWGRFRNYEALTFRIGKQKLSAEGRYWKLEYKPTGEELVDSFSVANEYRSLLEQRAAIVNADKKGRDFLFELVIAAQSYTGKLRTYSNSISIEMIEAEAFKQTLKINPDTLRAELLSSGKVTLGGIYFDFDKATLQPRSDAAIQAAAVLLRKYPDLKLEVQGHTDSKGNADYNLKLSQRRAAAVVKAIVKQGIEPQRLTPKGLEQTQPITSNDDEAGRAKNRRVELHRIQGGEARALIGIDFIKPIPGAIEKNRWHYDHEESTILYRKPYAEERSKVQILGSVDRVLWQFEKDGKVDRSVSPKEIIKNYLGVLELFGAEITGVHSNSIYFHLNDRGDGKEAYGILRAFAGSYQLSFILPAFDAVSSPAKETERQKAPDVAAKQGALKASLRRDVPKVTSKQNSPEISLRQGLATGPDGMWFFDVTATSVQAPPDADLRQYSGLTIEFAPNGALYYYGTAAGKWKLDAGTIFVNRDNEKWEPAPMEMVAGRLTMSDGELKLLFSRKAPNNKVETAQPQVQQTTESTAKHPWTVGSVIAYLTKVEKLQYLFENVHQIQDTRTWHMKREGDQLLSRLHSTNQGEFIDSDWVYFDTEAGDSDNGPLVSSGLRSRTQMSVAQAQTITVPAGTFDCAKVYTRDRFDRPVEAWLINARPGVPAKIVTHDATYKLEKIYPL